MRTAPVLFVLSVHLLNSLSLASVIENDSKKEYKLEKRHGPWMIMVASFSDVDNPKQKKDGLTAEQAARKLVHELRAAGYPAYVYAQDGKKESIDTFDRQGNKDKRIYQAQRGMICVLQGNYKKIDDPVAQSALAIMKKFRPKFLADPKSGAIARTDTGQLGPFAGAFMTINPMLDPNDIANRETDNLIRSLNSGIEYPLVKVRHKYTLRIATFTGKSAIPMGGSKYSGRESNFDKAIHEAGPYSLARAGEDATQLTYALRAKTGIARTLGRPWFEAYVYHDRVQSCVTIGGFDSIDDPEIQKLGEIFMAKYKLKDGNYVINCETLSLPGSDPRSPPVQTWAFDPKPELIEIPRLK